MKEKTVMPLRRTIWPAASVALILAMIVAAAVLAASRFPYSWDDSPAYIAMAQGLPSLMPWAGRILLPALAADIHGVFGLSLDRGFEFVTCLSFLLWISIVAGFWRGNKFAPLFLLTPLTLTTLQAVYITDMLHMGLTALFLWLARRNWWLLAAGLVPIMYTARESTMLIVFVSVAVLCWHRKFGVAALITVGYVIGSIIVHRAVAGVQNVHGMPEIFYLFTKLPANFLRDWLGIKLWTNGYTWCDLPVVTMSLPNYINLGKITEIGFCAPTALQPLSSLASYLTAFGILPAVLIKLLRNKQILPVKSMETWWAIAFFYGALMTVIGPTAGPPADRAIGFGWPLFLMALPAAFGDLLDWRLAALNIIAVWSPLLFNSIAGAPDGDKSFIGLSLVPTVSLLSIVVGVVANAAAYNLTKLKVSNSPTPSSVFR